MTYQDGLEEMGRKRGIDLDGIAMLAAWAQGEFHPPSGNHGCTAVEVALSPGDATVYRILMVRPGVPFNHNETGYPEHPSGRIGEYLIVLMGDIGTSCPFDFSFDLNEFDGQRWVRPGTSEWTGVVMALFLNYFRRSLPSRPTLSLDPPLFNPITKEG